MTDRCPIEEGHARAERRVLLFYVVAAVVLSLLITSIFEGCKP